MKLEIQTIMIEPITTVEAIKILKEINTKGSAPLLVIGNDDNNYFAKTSLQSNPSAEVVNELLCAYFAKCWSLNVPDFCLIHIPNEVVTSYINSGVKLSNHYKNDFQKNVLFGSKQIWPAIEVDGFLRIKKKSELKQFTKPIDFLKIGAFDLWIGNKDRKPENPNVLIGNSEELFEFHPIDHVAAFAYHENYNDIRGIHLYVEMKDCIVSTDLAKTICRFVGKEEKIKLKADLDNCILESIKHLDLIFDQVPRSWGLSKRSKDKLKAFFSDDERNKEIVERFLSYLV